jgi:hypothetical protein
VSPQLLIFLQMETQLMTHTLLTQMEIFMFGTDQLGIALDKLLEQQVPQARLDLQVLQEAQEQREALDQLELKEMWELLDQLVPQDQQD